MRNRQSSFARRDLLKLGAALGALGLGGAALPRLLRAESESTPVDPRDRKLLFVLGAFGGASIIDSFLPVVDTQAGEAAATLNCFPEQLVEQLPGSAFRTVKILDDYSFYAKPTFALSQLVARHGADLTVIGHDVSSVNHTVGQQRALNGAGFDRGRTIMESVAIRYGAGLPLPSCNMAVDGYVMHGADESIPVEARHEVIMAPQLFAAGTHGYQGVADAPDARDLERARKVRNKLDARSAFGRTFVRDARLKGYLRTRAEVSRRLEQAGLLEKLLLIDPASVDPKYGVKLDPLAVAVRAQLPEIDEDRLQQQVGLAFLLAYHGVSTSVTVGYSSDPVVRKSGAIVGTPLSFDFSHNMHRIAQSMMWTRTASLLDALITLLKTHDYLGDPKLGKMWDRSLVYVATEFGRDKQRPASATSWGTGHDLNNGAVLISPLLKGNAVYGGVDPKTGLTYGFDPSTGKPDPARKMSESDVYGIIAHALGIEVPGGQKYPGVVRG